LTVAPLSTKIAPPPAALPSRCAMARQRQVARAVDVEVAAGAGGVLEALPKPPWHHPDVPINARARALARLELVQQQPYEPHYSIPQPCTRSNLYNIANTPQ
jgi:hypothetical protein